MRDLFSIQIRKRNRVSRQLVRRILGFYLMFAVILTSGHLFLEFKNEKNRLDAQLEAVGVALSPSMERALWQFDVVRIQALLAGLIKDDSVVGASLMGGDHFYHVGTIENDLGQRIEYDKIELNQVKPNAEASIPYYDVLYQKIFPLQAPELHPDYMGKLIVFSSSKVVFDNAMFIFGLTIASAFIKTLILWWLTVWICNQLISKPVLDLSNTMVDTDVERKATDLYRVPCDLEMEAFNELDWLQEIFKALRSELANRNHLIDMHANHLETVVEEKVSELKAAFVEMERLNQVKTDFLSNMSHELRTPLNSIIGFTKRICNKYEDQLQPGAVKGLMTVLKNGNHLLAMINDILDIAKIEAGTFELNLEVVHLKPLVDDVVDLMSPIAIAEQIHLSVGDVPVDSICLDSQRFKQVLINLLSNAVKFTDAGGEVRLEMDRVAHDGYEGVEFKVIDTGIGIEQDDFPKLFSKYEQVDMSGKKRVNGAGLGLMLVKDMVTMHGGRVAVESTPGKGSCFSVWFPSKDKPVLKPLSGVIGL